MSSEETTLAPGAGSRLLPPIGAAMSLIAIFVSVLGIVLDAAADLQLTISETAGWIAGVYGVAGFLGLVLAIRHRQPLILTGNVFVLIFISRLGAMIGWPELIGAAIVAGVVVLLMGPLGLTARLAYLLPGPIVYGLLAGAVLSFVVDMFEALPADPLLVGGTVAVYVAGRAFLEPRVPAILPALVVGLVIAAAGGRLGPVETTFPLPGLTAPVFSPGAIVTVAPVMVVLIAVQANLPSLVFLHEQGYFPPERTIGVVSGAGTVLGSLLGPTGVSLSLPATALAAGPDAGDHEIRRWSAYIAGSALVVIGLLAGVAAQLIVVLPRPLIVAVVGLAVLPVLGRALRNMSAGPLVWGPLFAFVIALSSFALLGLGRFFWALVGGIVVSFLAEREEWRSMRT